MIAAKWATSPSADNEQSPPAERTPAQASERCTPRGPGAAAQDQRPAPVRVRPRARLPLRRRRRRGRPRLAGRPAGRRGRAVRPRAADALGPARAQPAERLQAAHRRDARGALPARAAGGGALGDRVPVRARHRRARPAQHEPRGAAHGAAGRRPRRAASAWSTASACPTSASSSAPSSTATAAAPRSPRRRCSPRSAATATCARPPSAIPSWDFETNVGYSTPEHRAAIAAARRLAAAPAVVPVDRLQPAGAREARTASAHRVRAAGPATFVQLRAAAERGVDQGQAASERALAVGVRVHGLLEHALASRSTR